MKATDSDKERFGEPVKATEESSGTWIPFYFCIILFIRTSDMNAMTFTEVVRAEYAGGYRVRLWFNDETVKTVDLEQSLKGSAFEPLKDVERFKRFEVKYATIGWENGADLAPEYLFELPAVE